MTDMKQWRGLKDLLSNAVQQGASAIEQVHLQTARRPFVVLEQVAGLREPVQGIHQVHDAIVTSSYGAVRAVAAAVDKALDTALNALDDTPPSEPEGQ